MRRPAPFFAYPDCRSLMDYSPIGIFDSGFGGLTVLKEIEAALADYDFLYLGDNARTPYGNRSFEIVYAYTLEAVKWLFDRRCPLVIIACNTAASKALRTIQQKDLPGIAPERRVLGILRPVTEQIGHQTKTGHVGILATAGTVASNSYAIEITRFFPDITVVQEACPMWVPLVENNESGGDGADYFVKRHIERLTARDPRIDTVVLGCTHYPLLLGKIARYLPPGIEIVTQGPIVAESLADYLNRHPEIADRCGRGGRREFYTSEKADVFNKPATLFYGKQVRSREMEFK